MAISDRYKSPDDLPGEIPVFPLAGAILLPRATLPLNIFEPRYLAMVESAIAGSRMIGMIQPAGEGGTTGSPEARDAGLRGVGCAGRITSFQELDDGRYLITLTGIARFVAVSETTSTTPFRTFAVDFTRHAADLVPIDGDGGVDRSELLSTLKAFLEARRLSANWEAIRRTTTEVLVNSLSMASPFGVAEKQALVEAGTVAARAELLIGLARMDATAASGGAHGSKPTLQ